MEDVGRYSPVLIEDITDGYMTEFFERGGRLLEPSRADLVSCSEDLSALLPLLDDSARGYFEVLRDFARTILELTAVEASGR